MHHTAISRGFPDPHEVERVEFDASRAKGCRLKRPQAAASNTRLVADQCSLGTKRAIMKARAFRPASA